MSPPSQPIPEAACALERFLKNHSRARQTTRTLSPAFPNSRSRTPPRAATGIRADARAYTPARDGGLREKVSICEALGGFWGDSGGEGWGNSGKDG
jgi:hypothetical protein